MECIRDTLEMTFSCHTLLVRAKQRHKLRRLNWITSAMESRRIVKSINSALNGKMFILTYWLSLVEPWSVCVRQSRSEIQYPFDNSDKTQFPDLMRNFSFSFWASNFSPPPRERVSLVSLWLKVHEGVRKSIWVAVYLWNFPLEMCHPHWSSGRPDIIDTLQVHSRTTLEGGKFNFSRMDCRANREGSEKHQGKISLTSVACRREDEEKGRGKIWTVFRPFN